MRTQENWMIVTNGFAGRFAACARSLSILAAVSVLLASCSASKSSPTPTVAVITVTPAPASIAMNATQQFTATAKDSSGSTISGVTFAWTSSAPTVATINSSTGVASGVSAGTTQITASASGISSSADVLTVTAPVIATIAVTPASQVITVSSTQQFTATAKDSGGNTITGVTGTQQVDSSEHW
jgi:uncharacterized protein YjdB